ncbi:long-chain fatty acid--CoA ligase [Dermacoccus abyssi]|nr:long-chain fatty acid--CoA ligase [Dermacoccus abyssi]MCT1986382.1 long-chain fatty acid--CoA ligase [Dermacoccus abyssi]
MVMNKADETFDRSILDNRARSVAHLFTQRVAKSPHEEGFRFAKDGAWKSMTWAQTDKDVRAIAAGLISLGIEGQERVAIASSTRLEWVLADLGTMLAGAATTTVYPTSQLKDVVHILTDSGSRIVFAEDAEQVDKLRQGRDQIGEIVNVVTFDGEGDGDWVITLDDLQKLGEELLAKEPNVVEERMEGIQPEHLATLIYTSGTTGPAKGVRLPHSAWAYEAAAVDSTGLLNSDDVQYLWLPLAHVFGKMLLCLPMQVGFPTVVDGRVDKIVENLPETKPTWMGAAPRIFEKVYARINGMMEADGGVKLKLYKWSVGVGMQVAEARAQGHEPSGALAAKYKLADKLVLAKIRDRFGGQIRYFISGSAALNKDVALWFSAVGMPVLEGYGLSESSAAASVNRPYLGANQAGTVGWPLPGTEFKLGEDDELLVKGPGVMQGYWNLEEETSRVLVDGWFHTGDIGAIDESGHIRITDRKKDLFKTSNGKYVSPGAIEAMFKGVCPYASNLVVEGDGRKFVSALITLDEEAIAGWAEKNGMAGKSYRDIVTSDACREMVQGYVDEMNLQLNRWEQIKRFIILPRDLSIEEGEITPSLKLKRRVVVEKFKSDLDGLYTD